MRILLTNDDGYNAKGIKVLAEIMKQFGEVTVIAPKTHQSGMSMAVSLGFKQIAHKDLGKGWHYVDATPASCVKFGLNTMFLDNYPDVVVSGINHGSNASTASCYSGTLGAAEEAAGPSTVTVTLVNAGAAKINVIKVIKEITGLGLKESKDIADNGGAIKEGISVDEANDIKAKLEEAGAEVEVK